MIFHITPVQNWVHAISEGTFSPEAVYQQEYVPCCTFNQLIYTANKLFKGQGELVILCIKEEALTSPVSYAQKDAASNTYPYIQGPLNLEAVVNVVDLEASADGTFELPEEFALFNQEDN